jgi:hypothetical protein
VGPSFTAEEKLAAVRRELVIRRAVFADRVRRRKMKQSEATYQVEVFEAIERDYQLIVDSHN